MVDDQVAHSTTPEVFHQRCNINAIGSFDLRRRLYNQVPPDNQKKN